MLVTRGDFRENAPPFRVRRVTMNLHEYQAKDIFRSYGIAVPAGRVAASADEAVKAAEAIGGSLWVVKAQVHAGGRG
jgi:succinyl-CoA synthetase beta subunit